MVRRLNRLYNQLAGPIPAGKLQYVLAAAGVLTLTGCPALVGGDGGEDDPANAVPVVSIEEGDIAADPGQEVTFTAIATDDDGDSLSYQWFVNEEEEADATGETLTVSYRPEADTTYSIKVEVSDATDTASDRVDLTVGRRPADSPSFGSTTTNPFGIAQPTDGFRNTELADLDGDGDLDLFYQDGYYSLALQVNTGDSQNPSFGNPITDPYGLVGYSLDLYPSDDDRTLHVITGNASFGDLDADGDLDAVLSLGYHVYVHEPTEYASTSSGFAIAENTGMGSPDFGIPELGAADLPTFGVSTYYVDSLYFSRPELVDLDADGDLDLLYATYITEDDPDSDDTDYVDGGIRYIENIGTASNPSFGTPQEDPFGISVPAGTYVLSVNTVDIDGDGDQDVILGVYDPTDGFLHAYFENTGSAEAPSFAARNVNPFGLALPSGVDYTYTWSAFGDLDGDGDFDAIPGTNPDVDGAGEAVIFFQSNNDF